MVHKKVANLWQERLEVLVGEVVELVADKVEDPAAVAVAVEIADGHPGVKELGAKEAQKPAHRK